MIPIYKPYFTENNLKYAHDAINSGWVSSQGEYLDLSKNKLKDLLGTKKVILTSNGTTATHLLALSLKYKYPLIGISHVNIKFHKKSLPGFQKGLVENTGFEPVASCLPGKRSSQMS